MKRYFYFFSLAFFIISFNSCSDNLESNTINDTQQKSKQVDELIVNYYGKDFSIKESVTIENQNIKVTSFKSSSQENPIGYMITDLNTDNLLTFIDVNVAKNEVTIIDEIKGITATSNTFFEENNINKKESFDLIEIIRNAENENVTAKKGFGWECHAGSCSTCIECCYRVFWVNVLCQETDFAF